MPLPRPMSNVQRQNQPFHMKDKISILIADAHLIVRTGLTALLGTEKDLEVVGQAKNGIEAVSEAARLKPDIVIMDLQMPKKDGVTATAAIAAAATSASRAARSSRRAASTRPASAVATARTAGTSPSPAAT